MVENNETQRIEGAVDVSNVYERFGKSDFLASVLGMFTGLGVLVFISSLIAAGAAGIDFQLNQLNDEGLLDEASIAGLIVAALVVFASFWAGGFAAGRMARYNGGINGLSSGLYLILIVAIFAALGAFVGPEYNAFNRADLPNWFAQLDAGDLTTAAVVGAAVLIAATLLGGYLGGRLGEVYHTKVDAALVDTVRKEA